VIERPRSLRPPPRSERGRRLARWIAARNSTSDRVLRALGVADQRLLLAMRTRGHSGPLDRLVGALGGFGEMGAGWAAIGALGAGLDRRRRAAWMVGATAAPAGMLANYLVKLTVGRQRPLLDGHPPLARAPSKLSFPSGHATSGFAGAVALGRVAPELRPALLGLATAICLGRPYLGMHYPSDVFAGAALGATIGALYPLPAEHTEVRVEVEEVSA
jgi:undecaprenyl-diphosphatase